MSIEGAERVQPFNWRPAFAPSVPTVVRSEPCWGLTERILNGQRFQIIAVNRGDKIAECWVPLPLIHGQREFDLFCAFEHSVGEARDWADEMREDKHWDNVLAEEAANSTLFKRFWQQVENDAAIVKNRSTFGPGGKIQRNGWHHKSRDPQQFTGITLPGTN